jgi:hypothetical protein
MNSVRGGAAVDGIDAYSRTLAAAVVELGATCGLLTKRAGDWCWCEAPVAARCAPLRSEDILTHIRSARAVVVQYNPFSWGGRGFSPALVKLFADMRRRAPGTRLILMLHERFTPWGGWRQTIMSGWQRAQLLWLSAMSDQTLASTESWTHDSAWWRRRQVQLLPVGSNLPDMRGESTKTRRQIGAAVDTVFAVTLNTGHPSYSPEHVRRAVNHIATVRPVVLFNLGAGAHRIGQLHPGVRVLTPGMLRPESLSSLLSAGDLYLAPFVDGVSTRRTSLVAALQHALPVVGTTGQHTGEILRPLRLYAYSDLRGFADAALEFATDPEERTRHRLLSRQLYDTSFSWPFIAGQLLEHVRRESQWSPPSRSAAKIKR